MTRPTRIPYGESGVQFGELHRPSGPAEPGVVVVIHGGFWRARYDCSLGTPLAADLARRGHVAWNLEYRRVGAGGGWPNTLADIAAGIDHLATMDLDVSRVRIVGHSAGGHLAVWAASRERLPPGSPGAAPTFAIDTVVAQAGVLDLATAARTGVGGRAVRDLLGGSPDEVPERYLVADPVALVPPAAAVVCLHSRRDDAVPFAQSEAYVAAATAAGGTATLIETTGDHFTMIDPGHPDWSAAVTVLTAPTG